MLKNIDWSALYWGPLSTLIGATLGAVITGVIAIWIMNNDHKIRIKENNDKYRKSYIVLKKWSPVAMTTGVSILDWISSDNPRKKDVLSRELSALNECINKIDKINEDYIPAVVYENFLDIKLSLELVSNTLKPYLMTIKLVETKTSLQIVSENTDLKQAIIDIIPSTIERIEKNISEFEKYNDNLK